MSIQKRGDSYYVRYRRDGKHHGRSFARKRDAEVFELEQRRAAQLGAHAPAAPSRRTLGDWLDEWFASESPLWAASTRTQRKDVVERWVRPYAGQVRLSDLGSRRVREWRSAIVNARCPHGQANAALSVLSAACGVAVRDGLLPANPCLGVGRLPVRVVRPRALTPLELERIMARMPRLRDRVAVALMAYAGLRPEEMLALRWDDVLDHVLVVDRAFTYGEEKGLKVGSRRTVELIAPLSELLDELRPARPAPGALVCPSETNGYLDLHNWRRRVWLKAREAAGVAPAVPNDCRHSYASMLIREGRSLPYVSAAMGHSNSTTTLKRYVHLFHEQRHAEPFSMVDAVAAARVGCAQSVLNQPVRRLRQAAPGA